MATLVLARRAATDIAEIERFSVAQWGRRVAEEYLDGIEHALVRLRAQPELLRTRPQISRHFGLYRVGQHFLVGVIVDQNVYILAACHAAIDLPNRLMEWEPGLLAEAEQLHRRFLAQSR